MHYSILFDACIGIVTSLKWIFQNKGFLLLFSFPRKYKVQWSPFAYSQNGKKVFVFSQSTGHKDLVQALIPEIVPKKLN